MTVVACQGIEGSFSHMAALEYFGGEVSLLSSKRFAEAFAFVTDGQADVGIIPIENTLAGSIHENFDLLREHDLSIVGEYRLKVEHHLLAIPAIGTLSDERIREIRKVLSHPKAIEQCVRFLSERPWLETSIFSDTAGAARHVAITQDRTLAAIASREAATLYGLEPLSTNIEDDPNNITRFAVISRSPLAPDGADKCTLFATLPHEPGSLLRFLAAFAEDGANVTKLESRPIHGRPFEYLFYVDLLLGQEREKVVDRARERATDLRVLGYYSSHLRPAPRRAVAHL